MNTPGACDVVVLQPPSPPFLDIEREWQGGLGQGTKVVRSTWGHSRTPFYNHSLAWTAGTLERAGYGVLFLDAQALRMDKEQVVAAVRQAGPRALFMLVNVPSLHKDLELMGEIKSRVDGVTTVAVGSACRVLSDTIGAAPAVDVVVYGESEDSAPEVMAALDAGGDLSRIEGVWSEGLDSRYILRSGFVKDLDTLPMTPFHLMPMDRYRGEYIGNGRPVAPIVSSKGCPFACGYYCPYPVAYGSKVRQRSPESVLDEIEKLRRDHGISHLIFRDQNFTFDADHARALCHGIIDRGLDVTWVCETRFALVGDDDILDLMRSAGCEQINFGLETADPALFESVGKPGTEPGEAERVLSMARKAGIDTHAHMIVGLPGETWTSVVNTARALRRLDLDSLNFGFLTPFPGTGFYEDARARGHIRIEDWSRYTHSEPVVRTENMSLIEIKLAQVLLTNTVQGFHLHRNLAAKMARGIARAYRSLTPQPGRRVQ